MNNDQIQSIIRYVLTIAATIATSHGWLTSADSATLVTYAMAVVGPLIGLVVFVWGLIAHSADSKIASVNAIPTVKVVPAQGPGMQVEKP